MTPHEHLLSRAARGMRFSAIRRMSALIERPGIISFAPGQPSPETFPTAELGEMAADILSVHGATALQYILTRGLAPLIEAVRAYAAAKGVQAAAAETLITDGSQQGLDLVSRVLLDPGDAVLVELPSYVGAISAFRAAQAHMVGVRLDEDGLDLGDLRRRHRALRAEGRPVKFLYVTPSFQNPSGIRHTLERRRGLLEAIRDLDLLVLEDDPYGDLCFEGEPLPPLKSMDADGRVLYLSSFSKILAPGLRTAFLIGPEDLLAKVEIAKQSANLCGSGLDQRLVLACLEGGLLDRQRERIRPYYRSKCAAMLEALAAGMPEGITWTRPAGGLFVWLRLPEDTDAEVLLEAAVAEGVAYVIGRPFFVDESGSNTMRLTFAKESETNIREGIGRLSRVIRAHV